MRNQVISFFSNYPLICSLIGWFVAQTLKIFTSLIKEKKLDFRKIVALGGMPSSHSSTVCALATAIARSEGFSSASFAIAFMFAFVVMTDAAGVRHAAGEQAKLLNRIVRDIAENRPSFMQKKLKEFIGHTPLEVVVGALLGILIALLVPYNGA